MEQLLGYHDRGVIQLWWAIQRFPGWKVYEGFLWILYGIVWRAREPGDGAAVARYLPRSNVPLLVPWDFLRTHFFIDGGRLNVGLWRSLGEIVVAAAAAAATSASIGSTCHCLCRCFHSRWGGRSRV